jgi:hypothetical protein
LKLSVNGWHCCYEDGDGKESDGEDGVEEEPWHQLGEGEQLKFFSSMKFSNLLILT